jgi:nucleoside 2-deoxyribosyltransferase
VLIYFAGPLFSAAERCFNLGLTQRLEAVGFEVFLPQRDGAERDRPPYDAMTPEERRQAMFRLDRSRILDSDVFLFVLDGRVPDEGACVELGIALIGLHTDTRAAFVGARLNPMVRVPLDYVVDDEQSLLELLAGYETGGQGSTP